MQAVKDEIYTKTQYHSTKHEAKGEVLKLIADFRAVKFRRFVSPDDEVLEFGVGAGWNLMNLPAHRRVGFDIATQFESQIRDSGIEFFSNISQLHGQKFDVVIIAHVLEHLTNDADVLVQMKNFLRPNGRLVAMVPYEYQRRLRNYSPGNMDFHVHAYNVQTLVNLLKACGYEVQRCDVRPWGYDRYAANLAVRLGGGQGLHKLLVQTGRLIRPEKEIHALATVTS